MGVSLVEVDAVGGEGVDGEAADDIGRFAVGLSGRGGREGTGEGAGWGSGGVGWCFLSGLRCAAGGGG